MCELLCLVGRHFHSPMRSSHGIVFSVDVPPLNTRTHIHGGEERVQRGDNNMIGKPTIERNTACLAHPPKQVVELAGSKG